MAGATLLLVGLLSVACEGDPRAPATRATLRVEPSGPLPEIEPPSTAGPRRKGRQTDPGRPPNIVLITTDDQNVTDLAVMPRTQRLLGHGGITFTALSPHPLCCPARAEILTGQYAQNNGVQHNHGTYGGYSRLDVDHTIGGWLQAAGYETAFIGKFLNEYGGRNRPPGWTIWNATTSRWYSYYGTTFYDGVPASPEVYSVDLVSSLTEDAIRELAQRDRPFFIWSSQVAPHGTYRHDHWGPPRVAARYADRGVPEAPSAEDPAFNLPGPRVWALQGERALHGRGFVQHYFAQRARSLMAVDDAVAETVRALRAAGELENSYIFFTSDNGYLLGEHALVGKNVLYRQSLEVPLLVRGPGVGRARSSAAPVTLTDLAPTFLDIARARADVRQDGTSFLPLLRGDDLRWRDSQLIQTGSRRRTGASPGWSYRGVRTDRYTFGVHSSSGRLLLFDRGRDPHELRNLAYERSYRPVVAELERRTRVLAGCAGESCRRSFGPVPIPTRRGSTLPIP